MFSVASLGLSSPAETGSPQSLDRAGPRAGTVLQTEKSAAALVLGSGEDGADEMSADLPWTRVYIRDAFTGDAARGARWAASKRLAKPACQSMLSEFRDERGLPLTEKLRELGASLQGYLRLVVFLDGGAARNTNGRRPGRFRADSHRFAADRPGPGQYPRHRHKLRGPRCRSELHDSPGRRLSGSPRDGVHGFSERRARRDPAGPARDDSGVDWRSAAPVFVALTVTRSENDARSSTTSRLVEPPSTSRSILHGSNPRSEAVSEYRPAGSFSIS
jgi:hypothetical protein